MSDSLWPPWTSPCDPMGRMEFSRPEYWSGYPFPSPGDLPNQGLNPGLPHCRQILYQLSPQGSPRILECFNFKTPSPADLPSPGIERWSPAIQADSLPTYLSGKPKVINGRNQKLDKVLKWKWKSLGHVWLFATPWTVVHGILQARILEWVAFPFSRGFSQPRDQTQVCHIAGRFFTSWATREAQEYWSALTLRSFLQQIFPTQGLNPGIPYCRQILYQLSPQGSPKS